MKKFFPPKLSECFVRIFILLFAGIFIFGAAEVRAATFTVSKTADTFDGVCNADCSLREAIAAANANPGDDLIEFSQSVFATLQTILLSGTDIEIAANGSVQINGTGSTLLRIDNNFADRIFFVQTGANLILDKLTLRRGDAENGGAIFNNGTVTITNCALQDNTGTNSGGAIQNEFGTLDISNTVFERNSTLFASGGAINSLLGTVTIFKTAINNNSAGGFGGGIQATGGTLNADRTSITNNTSVNGGGGIIGFGSLVMNLTNSTVSGNQSANGGGININNSTLILNSSTIANNSAGPRANPTGSGGGILNSQGFVQSINTIIADNIDNGTAPDFNGVLNSEGYNLIENTTGTTITGNTTGNIIGQGPHLGTLMNNGGLTLTQALMANSPAIDAANPASFPPTDQRSVARPVDGDNNGSALPDIGAFEANMRWVVTKTADTFDGACDTDCSLRDAIATANATVADDLIEFAPEIFSSPQTLLLNGTDIIIRNSGKITIRGTGVDMLNINANGQSRIFFKQNSSDLTLENLKISGGKSRPGPHPSRYGGAIYNEGFLTLLNVELTNNTDANGGAIWGGSVIMRNSNAHDNSATFGAVFNSVNIDIKDSVLRNNRATSSGGVGNNANGTIENSTVSNNTALVGGGFYVTSSLTSINSVFENNSANDGGAIFCTDFVGLRLTLLKSTIRNNSANAAGGIYAGGTNTITDSTISNNTASNIAGGIFNRIGTLNIVNSTIYGNSALLDGGGINNRATLNLTNVTVAANHATSGAGILSINTATVNARNSLFADNLTNSSQEDFFGTLNSGGYNLIESLENTNIIGDTTGNIIGQNALLDPRGLRNNGGPTQTVALLSTSPAIDSALTNNVMPLMTDQRGRIRPFDFPNIPNPPNGDGTDIGAFERQPDDNARTKFDFDGDGRTDVSIFRPTAGEWWYLRSSGGGSNSFQFGTSNDKIVPADYTGDGKTDAAFWRESSGEWFILRSEDASFYSFQFGMSGDIPAPGDFDGDGRDDAAVFRPSNQTWYILNSGGETTIAQFGTPGDVPTPGDYDGDGKADIAIFRPSDGTWWLNLSTAGLVVYNFGTGTDRTVQADYTGDGKTDVAFFRPSSNEWFILRSEDISFYSFRFGASGDIPAPGDYDGDGKSDPAVFRPSNNVWYKLQSTSGFEAVTFGITNDLPVPGAYVR